MKTFLRVTHTRKSWRPDPKKIFLLIQFYLLFFTLITTHFTNARADSTSQTSNHIKKRIGLYTGTFDPPHNGHLALLEEAIKKFNLDKIYILPNIDPPHKPGATKYEIRKEMVKVFFEKVPKVNVADRRLENINMGGDFQKVKDFLSNQYAEDEIYQILGADSIERAFANPKKIPKNFTLIVGRRDGYITNFPNKTASGNPVIAMDIPLEKGLSSTQIRKMISEGKHPSEISNAVYGIILQNRLYGAHTPKTKANFFDCMKAFRVIYE